MIGTYVPYVGTWVPIQIIPNWYLYMTNVCLSPTIVVF